MIHFLARHTFGRIALLPLVVAFGANSFGAWFATSNEQDRARLRHFVGWLAPEMEPHWQRVAAGTSAYEDLKNVGSERFKIDGQRNYKSSSFTLVAIAGLAFVAGLVAGALA